MRVIVHLTLDGTKEIELEGDASIFDTKPGELIVRDLLELRDIGFWLTEWRYPGHSGPNQKGRVFIPWGSALFIEEVKELRHCYQNV